jgi:glycosyltransferase involved in cell wall biosynthesis
MTDLQDVLCTAWSISAVLPAHNEQEVIRDTVDACVETLSTLTPEYEVIVVDDGSTDRTSEIVDDLAARHSEIRALHNRPRLGYGGALTSGFAAASKDLVFFMDSDGQFDVSDIRALLRAYGLGWRVVLGYRSPRRDPLVRLINGWAWNQLVSLLYGLRVHDVDCGFKLYETALVRQLDVVAHGATVNVEMLLKLKRMGIGFDEVAVRHYSRISGKPTGADPRVIFRALADLIHLAQRVEAWNCSRPIVVGHDMTTPDSMLSTRAVR